MKKYNKLKFLRPVLLGVFAGSLFLVSCESDLQPDYPSQEAKPNVSLDASSYTVNEGEELTITLTTDKVFNDDMTFKLQILDTSTAVDAEDVEIDLDPSDLDHGNYLEDEYLITFPRFTSSYSFAITALEDYLNDPSEVINFKISPVGDMNGNLTQEFAVNVEQSDDILTLIFEWDQTISMFGASTTLCEFEYDNDFILADENGTQMGYIAGTSACPEMGQLSLSELGDGTYQIFQNVWDDGGGTDIGLSSLGLPTFSIPVTVTFMKGSTLSGSYTQSDANAVDSDFGSDPNALNTVYLVSFTVSGSTVTLFDATTSETIASGRMAKPQLKGLDKLEKRTK